MRIICQKSCQNIILVGIAIYLVINFDCRVNNLNLHLGLYR